MRLLPIRMTRILRTPAWMIAFVHEMHGNSVWMHVAPRSETPVLAASAMALSSAWTT